MIDTHMVIRAIVYAKTDEEAIEKAREIFENHCGDYKSFDYYQMFGTEDDTSTVSGSARWGKLPTVALANSKEGKKLISDGMKYTKDEFMENAKFIKEMLKTHTLEELWDKKLNCPKCEKYKKHPLSLKCGFFRYMCNDIPCIAGSSVWVYDDDGEAIDEEEHLKNVLNKWKCLYEDEGKENPHKDDEIWVIPADVHH